GAAWGDFDGDGRPDLYVTNHLNNARLYRNSGGGRFADVTSQWLSPGDVRGDKHGAAWADFNNDGRMGLVQLTGADRGVGTEAKRLFVNRGDRLENVAELVGIDNPYGRTRMPLWLDVDGDGRLDLFEGAEARFDERTPPFLFMRRGDKFEPSDGGGALHFRSIPFCVLVGTVKAAPPDLLCRVFSPNRPSIAYHTGKLPLQAFDMLPETSFEDVAIGDFDNKGQFAIFLARKNPAADIAFGHPSPTELIADAVLKERNADKAPGFTFRATGPVTFQIVPEFPGDAITPARVYLGSATAHPGQLTFSLTAAAPEAQGTVSVTGGGAAGVYIGRTSADTWQVQVTAPRDTLHASKGTYQQVTIDISSPQPITDVKVLGASAAPEEAPARMFVNHDGKWLDESDKRGLNRRVISAVSVVAGDFDNDMHLDLFVVGSGEVGKQENLLLMNRGDGTFDVIPGAGGAAGGSIGVGDTVTTVDFDGDGFLDLLITTGGSMGRSLGIASQRGGYQLFHNRGNGNHWLEIDLEGTKSNRDGIGARVELTAGGITQTRYQDGGVHNGAQNHARLHFGLAKHDAVDKVRVYWPSGAVQELTNVRANQIMRIREP
ncbi:MAG TPA: CRTAC1 family protein, partial [Burkholderiales bacterium]|nr:CRTAC1 family protein [Burkholderiales bacterium]